MNKKECPSCAMQIPDLEDVCPVCGYEFAVTVGNRKKTVVLALFLLFILIFIFVLV